jgi:hypothetical protein
MNWACDLYVGEKNACRVLVGKTELKKELGIFRHVW